MIRLSNTLIHCAEDAALSSPDKVCVELSQSGFYACKKDEYDPSSYALLGTIAVDGKEYDVCQMIEGA